MPTAAEQQLILSSEEFLGRVRHLAVKIAIAVVAEGVGGPGQPTEAEHVKRVALAGTVLAQPDAMARLMAVGVVTNATVGAASPDADIEFTLASMWDAYSEAVAPASAA